MSESTEPSTPLVEALKAKGVGARGNRPLASETLKLAFEEMASQRAAGALEAAFVTAFRLLDQPVEERALFEELANRSAKRLHPETAYLCGACDEPHGDTTFRTWFIRLRAHTEFDASACAELIDYLLDSSRPPRYKAALLQGLRIKRETDLENSELLRALHRRAPRLKVDLPHIIEIADPFDGMTRGTSLSLYVACILAALGHPTLLSASRRVGPKYGETAATTLRSLGWDSTDSFKHAGASIIKHGFACVLQRDVFPELHALSDLRNDMIKRPFLSTFEKMLSPLRANRQYLVTGYVHRDYRSSIPHAVRSAGIAERMLLVKGLEGSILLGPGRANDGLRYIDADALEEVAYPYAAENAVCQNGTPPGDMSKNILSDPDAPCGDILRYTAAGILVGLGLMDDMIQARDRVLHIVKSGVALKRLSAFLDSPE